MKKIFRALFVFLIAIMFVSCSKPNTNNTDNIVNDNLDFDQIIVENELSENDFCETENYLALFYDNNILIKSKATSEIEKVSFAGANCIQSVDDKIYFMSEDCKSIYQYDIAEKTLNIQYSADSGFVVNTYYVLDNENCIINLGEDNGEAGITINQEDFMYSFSKGEKIDINNDLSYKNVKYFVNQKTKDNSESKSFSRIYYSDKYYDTEFILDYDSAYNNIYYFRDDDKSDVSNLYSFSSDTEQESVIKQFDLKISDGYYERLPVALYSYHNELYLQVNINQKVGSAVDYETCELWKLDSKGKILNKYDLENFPDVATFVFFNGKFYYYDTDEMIHSINVEIPNLYRYKYINGFATFSYDLKDGYVVLTDDDYNENEKYYGKVRWCDEEEQSEIVSVSQVVAVDDKEVYNQPIEIVDLRNKNGNNHAWDYIACYEPQIKVKCSENSDVQCYIKLVDSNDVEYHAMLIPVEKYNKNGYCGSPIYVIDKSDDTEFWYDDYL